MASAGCASRACYCFATRAGAPPQPTACERVPASRPQPAPRSDPWREPVRAMRQSRPERFRQAVPLSTCSTARGLARLNTLVNEELTYVWSFRCRRAGWLRRRAQGRPLAAAIACGCRTNPGETAGSFLRVGSEIGHRIRHARCVRPEVVTPSRPGGHLRDRAAAFPRRLYATASRERGTLARTRSAPAVDEQQERVSRLLLLDGSSSLSLDLIRPHADLDLAAQWGQRSPGSRSCQEGVRSRRVLRGVPYGDGGDLGLV